MDIPNETAVPVSLGHLEMSQNVPSQYETFRQICESINDSTSTCSELRLVAL